MRDLGGSFSWSEFCGGLPLLGVLGRRGTLLFWLCFSALRRAEIAGTLHVVWMIELNE